ncbi:vascular endothelial growth factor B isoform X2 [Protopterus annectens]
MTHTAELFKLLFLVLLRISHSKMVQLHTEENSRSPEVIKWLEVYNRSFCQPRDVIVDINAEYPEEVEYIFMPSCVVLKRCAGCCVDEELECVPVRTQTVIMQIMKRKYLQSQMVEMQFLQHNQCECRPKRETKVKPERSQCSPCTEKRRHLNPETCECTCKMTQQRCRAKGLELNERNCRCETVRR